MREQEFKARDKKVQKMTRDGLVEKNLTQGSEQRISRRLADVSFKRPVPEDTAAARRAQSRTGKKQVQKADGKNRQGVMEPEEEAGRSEAASTPEAWGLEDAPVSMRDAGNEPETVNIPPSVGEMREKRGKRQRRQEASEETVLNPNREAEGEIDHPSITKEGRLQFVKEDVPETGINTKKQTAIRRQPEAKFSTDDTIPDTRPEKELPHTQKRSRLQFGKAAAQEAGTDTKDREVMKKQPEAQFSADDAIPGPESERELPYTQKRSRLQFDKATVQEAGTDTKSREVMKKQPEAKFSADDTMPGTGSERELPRKQKHSRLQFEKAAAQETGTDIKGREVMKKQQAVKFAADGAKTGGVSRLHYERSEIPPEERAAAVTRPDTKQDTGQGKSRQQKKYEKAEHCVKDAEEKHDKAQQGIPKRRRLHMEKQYDDKSGKIRRRLQFEEEVITEHEKPFLLKRAAKALGRTASTAAVMGIHQKIRESERDNTGVEAAHKAEFATERAAGRIYHIHKDRLHAKPYRTLRREKRRLAKAEADFAYQKLLMDNPELQKKTAAKWVQRQKIRRKYAQAAREVAKGAQHTGNVLTAAGQTVRAVMQSVVTRRTALGIIAAGVLIVALFGSLFTSCSAMLTGVESAIISTCYVADDEDINKSDLKYTELETDLQRNINNTEDDFPGYDEYRYNIGEIGHNPYELMGYLSAVYGAFTYAQVETERSQLFSLQYRLTREEIIETGTYIDENEEEQEYEVHILKTTLSVRPLSEIIAGRLTPGDQMDRYSIYMLTCGNRQCYGNPFDFSWLGYVTSPYGYRLHPDTGGKDLHRGIDIGVAQGTPIKAVQDGRVISAGNAGDYGMCIVIEGEDGYQSKYAHCRTLLVSAGQEVKRGDVIATVGNTGNSTGAHLHLEVTHNGEYLNPYYFVDNGGGGYTADGHAAGSPDIPDYSGEPMGDGSFAAMLAEAEKYLGYPYVWGGSSPATSFDCSGYVSWVINQSGVGNVGRQTAQGLYNLCTPVSKNSLQPGDLVFFTGTYSSASPVSHVGIYVGGGRMIHCGDPISYASINTSYWTAHFYSGGRLP